MTHIQEHNGAHDEKILGVTIVDPELPLPKNTLQQWRDLRKKKRAERDSLISTSKKSSRRQVLGTALKMVGVGVVTSAVEPLVDLVHYLQMLPLYGLDYSNIPDSQHYITLSEQDLEEGVVFIDLGDSIIAGYQGDNVPRTPPTDFVVNDLNKAGYVNCEALHLAVPGATTEDVYYNQIIPLWKNEWYQRQQAMIQGKPVDKRKRVIIMGDYGNDFRIPATQSNIHTAAKNLDQNGLLSSDLLLALDATIETTDEMTIDEYNMDEAILSMTNGVMPPYTKEDLDKFPGLIIASSQRYNVPISNLVTILGYDKGDVPTMRFIPADVPAGTHLTKEQIEERKQEEHTYNLATDPNARYAAHLVSADSLDAVRDSQRKFDTAGPYPFTEADINDGGLVKYNNGTEHLSPLGCFKLGREIMEQTRIHKKNGSRYKLSDKVKGYPPAA